MNACGQPSRPGGGKSATTWQICAVGSGTSTHLTRTMNQRLLKELQSYIGGLARVWWKTSKLPPVGGETSPGGWNEKGAGTGRNMRRPLRHWWRLNFGACEDGTPRSTPGGFMSALRTVELLGAARPIASHSHTHRRPTRQRLSHSAPRTAGFFPTGLPAIPHPAGNLSPRTLRTADSRRNPRFRPEAGERRAE